jgi:hypothetical protein
MRSFFFDEANSGSATSKGAAAESPPLPDERISVDAGTLQL